MTSQVDAIPQKEAGISSKIDPSVHSDSDANRDESIDDAHVQPGVQNIEAVTVAWTTTALVIAYVIIWLIYCM